MEPQTRGVCAGKPLAFARSNQPTELLASVGKALLQRLVPIGQVCAHRVCDVAVAVAQHVTSPVPFCEGGSGMIAAPPLRRGQVHPARCLLMAVAWTFASPPGLSAACCVLPSRNGWSTMSASGHAESRLMFVRRAMPVAMLPKRRYPGLFSLPFRGASRLAEDRFGIMVIPPGVAMHKRLLKVIGRGGEKATRVAVMFDAALHAFDSLWHVGSAFGPCRGRPSALPFAGKKVRVLVVEVDVVAARVVAKERQL